MHLKLFAVSAFAAAVSAQTHTSATTSHQLVSSAPIASSSGINTLSVLQILKTAVPSSLVQLYATNPQSAEHLVASELSVGSTPGWFQSLPTPVQTYLLGGAGTNYSTSSNATAIGNSSTTRTAGKTTRVGHTTHHTGQTTGRTTGGSSPSQSAAGAGSQSSSSSSGGASLPTAIVGAGIAGVVGMVGLLAL